MTLKKPLFELILNFNFLLYPPSIYPNDIILLYYPGFKDNSL